ncbi:MAG: hypothetical protein OXE50_01300 [Chloroflexi bacterium]|nr:hypothetical protein [Chloroflexota bacterium]
MPEHPRSARGDASSYSRSSRSDADACACGHAQHTGVSDGDTETRHCNPAADVYTAPHCQAPSNSYGYSTSTPDSNPSSSGGHTGYS